MCQMACLIAYENNKGTYQTVHYHPCCSLIESMIYLLLHAKFGDCTEPDWFKSCPVANLEDTSLLYAVQLHIYYLSSEQ